MSKNFKPWTTRENFVGEGVPKTARVLDILDVAACEHLSQNTDARAPRTRFASSFCDYSQSHGRRNWTKPNGSNHTFTRSTELYSYGEDRLVLPYEMLLMHGYPPDIVLPQELTQRKLKEMVGNGMSLPCLGTVLWALHIMRYRQFEAPGQIA